MQPARVVDISDHSFPSIVISVPLSLPATPGLILEQVTAQSRRCAVYGTLIVAAAIMISPGTQRLHIHYVAHASISWRPDNAVDGYCAPLDYYRTARSFPLCGICERLGEMLHTVSHRPTSSIQERSDVSLGNSMSPNDKQLNPAAPGISHHMHMDRLIRYHISGAVPNTD